MKNVWFYGCNAFEKNVLSYDILREYNRKLEASFNLIFVICSQLQIGSLQKIHFVIRV